MRQKTVVIAILLAGFYLVLATTGMVFAFSEIETVSPKHLPLNTQGLAEANKKVKRINRNILPAKPFIMLSSRLKEKLNEIDEANEYLDLAGKIIGNNGEEKTYLVVLQNNTELRPSGGFWGSYATLKIKNGAVVSLATEDALEVDNENRGVFNPPSEAAEIIGDQWRFWNANWSPDFKESARQGLFFLYQTKPEEQFDGVFAVDTDYLLALLEIAGAIHPDGYAFDLDKNNFLEKMVYEQTILEENSESEEYDNKIRPSEKKIILADMGRKIAEQAIAQKKERELTQTTHKALQSGSLQIFMEDPATQLKIERVGWGGRIPQSGNFAMLVDANLGSKLDLLVEKNVEIEKISPGRYLATATYHNSLDPIESKQHYTTYRSLTRLFIPQNSKVIEQSGGYYAAKPAKDESTLAVVGSAMIIVKPGETQTITFLWEVSPQIAREEIKILKQPGSHIKINNLCLNDPRQNQKIGFALHTKEDIN